MDKIYEVIRVIDKQPIFLIEHLHRMQHSLEHYTKAVRLDLGALKVGVEDLIARSEKPDFNIRIEYEPATGATGFFAVDGIYPSPEMEQQGVRLVTFDYQRHRPNVKVYDAALRDAMDARKLAYGAFDLLYTHDGLTSEASKSNIFFIKSGELYTSPDELVLRGITRMKALEAAEELEISVHKRIIRVDELGDFEGAFLSGTSLHLLPIAQIDEHEYRTPHPLWQRLRERFDAKVIEETKRDDL